MRQNFDQCVCHPEVGINQRRDTIFIQFEVMNGETHEGTGKSHTVVMPMPDAMQLLQTLRYFQERFSLPEIRDDLAVIEISAKSN